MNCIKKEIRKSQFENQSITTLFAVLTSSLDTRGILWCRDQQLSGPTFASRCKYVLYLVVIHRPSSRPHHETGASVGSLPWMACLGLARRAWRLLCSEPGTVSPHCLWPVHRLTARLSFLRTIHSAKMLRPILGETKQATALESLSIEAPDEKLSRF